MVLVELGIGAKIIGWVLLIATALGFEIENQYLFLVGAVLLIAWVGYVLFGARAAYRGQGD